MFNRFRLFHFARMFNTWAVKICSEKIDRAKQINLQVSQQLRDVLPYNGSGGVAYTLRPESPEDIVNAGGFYAHSDIWISQNGNGMNRGCICFSLLPEVTTLFLRNTSKKSYLYAMPLHGKLFLPGGPYCQIISPGAFALPESWAVREVLGIEENRKIQLGPMMGVTPSLLYGNRFYEFSTNNLYRPAECFVDADQDLVHEIQHTPETSALQNAVKAYYLTGYTSTLTLSNSN